MIIYQWLERLDVGKRLDVFIVTWSGEKNMKLCSLIQVPCGWVTDRKGKFEIKLGNFLISHLNTISMASVSWLG